MCLARERAKRIRSIFAAKLPRVIVCLTRLELEMMLWCFFNACWRSCTIVFGRAIVQIYTPNINYSDIEKEALNCRENQFSFFHLNLFYIEIKYDYPYPRRTRADKFKGKDSSWTNKNSRKEISFDSSNDHYTNCSLVIS